MFSSPEFTPIEPYDALSGLFAIKDVNPNLFARWEQDFYANDQEFALLVQAKRGIRRDDESSIIDRLYGYKYVL